MCQAIKVRGISIPEVPHNFRIEILYNEAEAHFDLRVPINAHNILAPPQLRVSVTSVSDPLLYYIKSTQLT